MARHPSHRPPVTPAKEGGEVPEIPEEHAITRIYVLPADAAAEFMSAVEDDAEEPTAALRALLRGVAR
jgi:hypothetical protein